tara:strand:- start:8738 stop:9223 length:486 start_codon:yes stop_codon:yes gene_type:complete
MSEPDTEAHDSLKKKSKLPLIIGLTLGLAGAGGGFFAASSGMIFAAESQGNSSADQISDAMPDVAFVAVDPLVISLRAPSQSRHLRFRAQLEVPTQFQVEVEKLLPRVVDVLNSYLRALDMGDLEDPAALMRLRAQMLRRVQTVAGRGRVNDLLIMEFVLN